MMNNYFTSSTSTSSSSSFKKWLTTLLLISVMVVVLMGNVSADSDLDTPVIKFQFSDALSSDLDECNVDDHGLAFESLISLASLPSRIYSVASSALSDLLHLGGKVISKVASALTKPTAVLCLATMVYLNVTPKDKDFLQRLAVGIPLAVSTVVSFPLLLSSLPLTLISWFLTKSGDAISSYFSSPESFYQFVKIIIKKIKTKIFKKGDGKDPVEAADVIGESMKSDFVPIVQEAAQQWKQENVAGKEEAVKVEKWAASLNGKDADTLIETAIEAEQFSANLKNNSKDDKDNNN